LHDAPVLRTRGMHVLSGHLLFAALDVLPADTRYITFLRDPAERTLSNASTNRLSCSSER